MAGNMCRAKEINGCCGLTTLNERVTSGAFQYKNVDYITSIEFFVIDKGSSAIPMSLLGTQLITKQFNHGVALHANIKRLFYIKWKYVMNISSPTVIKTKTN